MLSLFYFILTIVRFFFILTNVDFVFDFDLQFYVFIVGVISYQ